MKKLEEFFDLAAEFDDDGIDDTIDDAELTKENVSTALQPIHDAIALRDKIDHALETVSNFKEHDAEMDDIAAQAIESYTQLMQTGMNMTDMAAGNVFGNAAQMLRIAKDAKDSKVDRKLKQLDMMLKKVRLDQADAKLNGERPADGGIMDRNELLAAIIQQSQKVKK